MNTKFVSVILPLYNAEKYVRQSVRSILTQSYANFELIIINDGSTDNSMSVIKEFTDDRIILINQENKGLSATLNIGLGVAKGELVARMDSDDIARYDRLEIQVKHFEKNKKLILLGTAINYTDVDGKYIGRSYPLIGNDIIKKYLFSKGNAIAHPTVMFRKSSVESVGGYSEEIGKYFEDHFLWCQLSKLGEIKNISECLLDYRLIPESLSGLENGIEYFNKNVLDYIKDSFNGDIADLNFIKDREYQENNLSKDKKNEIYNNRITKIKKENTF